MVRIYPDAISALSGAEKLRAPTGENLVGSPSRGLVIWDLAMERRAIVRNEQVCLEISRLNTDTTEPERGEFLMKTLGDT